MGYAMLCLSLIFLDRHRIVFSLFFPGCSVQPPGNLREEREKKEKEEAARAAARKKSDVPESELCKLQSDKTLMGKTA